MFGPRMVDTLMTSASLCMLGYAPACFLTLLPYCPAFRFYYCPRLCACVCMSLTDFHHLWGTLSMSSIVLRLAVVLPCILFPHPLKFLRRHV